MISIDVVEYFIKEKLIKYYKQYYKLRCSYSPDVLPNVYIVKSNNYDGFWLYVTVHTFLHDCNSVCVCRFGRMYLYSTLFNGKFDEVEIAEWRFTIIKEMLMRCNNGTLYM